MATVTLYPNVINGVSITVYAEDGVTLITAAGAIVTLIQEVTGGPDVVPAYYRNLCAQSKLVDRDPLGQSGDPITVAPVTRVSGSLVGALTASLSSRAILSDGEIVTTSGKSTSGDGGGMTFRGLPGVSSGADSHTRINCSNGQWRALEPDESGPWNPKWFGAVGDGVTDDTAAINLMISTGIARGVYNFQVPPGTFGICGSASSTGIYIGPASYALGVIFRGSGVRSTYFKILNNASDGNGVATDADGSPLADAGSRAAIDLWGSRVEVSDFSLYTDALVDPRYNPASPPNIALIRHGIRYQGFDATFGDIEISGPSGVAFRGIGSSFQVKLNKIVTYLTGRHGFWIQGNNTWAMRGCAANSCASFHSGVLVEGGQLTVDDFNVFQIAYPHGYLPVGWRPADTVGITYSGILSVRGCNFEDYTKCAIYANGNNAPDVDNCTFYSSVGGWRDNGDGTSTPGTQTPGPTRAIMAAFVDRSVNQNSNNLYFDPGAGGWGDPELVSNPTQQTDVARGFAQCRFQTENGTNLFFWIGRDWGPTFSITGGGPLYSSVRTFATAAFGGITETVTDLKIGRQWFYQQHQANGTFTAICGTNTGDTTAGNSVFNLPTANSNAGGDDYVFTKLAAANVLRIHSADGIKMGAATVTDLDLTGLYDSVIIRRMGATPTYVVIGKNF
jgi:hypothetical protein